MAPKTNYHQKRGDRARVKDQKKQAKLRLREEQSASRRDRRNGDPEPDANRVEATPTGQIEVVPD